MFRWPHEVNAYHIFTIRQIYNYYVSMPVSALRWSSSMGSRGVCCSCLAASICGEETHKGKNTQNENNETHRNKQQPVTRPLARKKINRYLVKTNSKDELRMYKTNTYYYSHKYTPARSKYHITRSLKKKDFRRAKKKNDLTAKVSFFFFRLLQKFTNEYVVDSDKQKKKTKS